MLDGLRQAGSLKVLFPRTAGTAAQAVLVNTAGGITGGDRFSVRASVAPGTALTMTTQAAERAYRAQEGETGRLSTRLTIGEDARFDWLPQETILFQGSALERSLSVEMASGARLLLAEPLVFGRIAMGETLADAWFRDRIDVRRGGERLFLDAMTLTGDVAAHLAHPLIAGGAGAMVTLLFVAPEAEAHLAPVRALLPATAGASLLRDDVLFVRALAPDSHLLRQSLIPILTRLIGTHLPRPWML